MKAPGLARGLSFALFAGLGTFPWQLVWAPWLGSAAAFAGYMLVLCVLALLWHAPSLRAGMAASALAALLLLPVALVVATPTAALLAGLLVLGLARSGLSYRRPFTRALAIELSLACAATGCALIVYDSRLFGGALAVWSFWLIESAFCLFPAPATSVHDSAGDAFDQARAAAERVMRTAGR